MSFPDPNTIPDQELPAESAPNQPDTKTILKHVGLFVLTFITVTFTGMLWVGQSASAEAWYHMIPEAALFASLLLGFLAVHEFGHYFAAVYHKVRVTLPYFIPLPIGIGTLGAVIKIKEQIHETKKLFDIGIAGPVAGFVASLLILLIGLATLPEPSFIENFEGHAHIIEHIDEYGTFPETPPAPSEGAITMVMGNTLLYSFIAGFFDNVPPMYEMYHYPFLFAGWLGLFFTALNLMPVGQLDGGHILYSLIGYRRHKIVARIAFGFIVTLGSVEAIPMLYLSLSDWLPGFENLAVVLWAGILFFLLRKAFHNDHAWISPVWAISLIIAWVYLYIGPGSLTQSGSLIWVVWSFFLAYFVRMEHPPVTFETELTPGRRMLGWISMVIFILCISPNPIYFIE